MVVKNTILSLIGITALLVVLSACSNLRRLTYPEHITYIEKNDLQGIMQRMSRVLSALDLVVANVSNTQTGQQEVLVQLQKLGLIVAELDRGNTVTNHSVVDDNIEGFRNDIAHASRMVSAIPANYYYAGKLTGSCTACHEYR